MLKFSDESARAIQETATALLISARHADECWQHYLQSENVTRQLHGLANEALKEKVRLREQLLSLVEQQPVSLS